jgi:hypothetical protein
VPEPVNVVLPARCSRQAGDPQIRTSKAPARTAHRIRRHSTILTSAILPGHSRRIGRHDCDGISIMAALFQRFSSPVFSCSNPIPEITEQVQKDLFGSENPRDGAFDKDRDKMSDWGKAVLMSRCGSPSPQCSSPVRRVGSYIPCVIVIGLRPKTLNMMDVRNKLMIQ